MLNYGKSRHDIFSTVDKVRDVFVLLSQVATICVAALELVSSINDLAEVDAWTRIADSDCHFESQGFDVRRVLNASDLHL